MSAVTVLASIARLHIVAIGALGALTFAFALTAERPLWLAVVVATDWFVVNLLNRVVDLREDQANGIVGADVVARHKRAVLAVGVTVLVLSLAWSAWRAPALVPLRLSFHALGFAYNWPLLPVVGRIKQRYFWKNTASAVGFLLTCFGYPLASFSLLPSVSIVTVLSAALFFFLFELSYEVIYDLRDLEGDRLAGVRSYPAVHGATAGFAIAQALMLASVAVAVVGTLLGALPWRIAIMAAAPLLQLAWARRVVPRGITSRDCIAITWFGVALLAGWHAWETLGLPGAGP